MEFTNVTIDKNMHTVLLGYKGGHLFGPELRWRGQNKEGFPGNSNISTEFLRVCRI